MGPPHNGLIVIEIIHSALIFILTCLIYLRTKESYSLTGHKGIKYFRKAFLFFGIAYVLRALVFTISRFFFGFGPKGGLILAPHFLPIIMLFTVAYVSSISMLYLFHGLVWKRLEKYNVFQSNSELIYNLISLIVSILVIILKSPNVIIVFNSIMILISVFYFIYVILMNKKMHSFLFVSYSFLFLFWILNFLHFILPRYMKREFALISYPLSIIIMGVIYYKVNKSLK